MLQKGEVFADLFAQKENLLTRIEARTKIAFIAIALLINLWSPTFYVPLGITICCLITLLAIKIPPKLLLLRLTAPLGIAAVVLITQIFFYGTTPMFTVSLAGFHLVGYKEGLVHGFLIMSRVMGGVSLILFLSMTTPTNKLLLATSWFRMPKIFVELTMLVYRYIFVLIEEAMVIKDAQKARLGYHNWRQSMRSLGVLGGTLVLRAYDRAERVFQAMLARGYTGSMSLSYQGNFGKKDLIDALCLGAILAILLLCGIVRGH
jgi:cobalt/nickel transport system permease protein